MQADTLVRLSACQEALARNPNDRDAVLGAGRLLRDMGQGALATGLLSYYLRSNGGDGEVRALAEEIAAWKPAPRAPERFEEISASLDAIPGWLLKEQEKFLFDKVKSLPDGAVILEMGCWKGKSTAAMAFACVGTRKRIYSIDTFAGNDGAMGRAADLQPAWAEGLRGLGLESYATPLRGYTFEVLPDRAKYPAPDFVFIDASHEFTDVLEDFRTVYPYVKEGGWIAFHDVELGWPGPWRVWRDYAVDMLADHQYSATLACGRKVVGRPFRRSESRETGFDFARVLADEYAARLGGTHPLVRAMRASLEGRSGTAGEREDLHEAEKRLMEAPEQDFHAVLNDMMVAVDGRVDGHIRLWHGLSLLGQGKVPEAAAHLLASTRVSSPVNAERVAGYLARARVQGVTPAEPAGMDRGRAAARLVGEVVRPTDTVIGIGGDGSLLAALACARKSAVEADRDLRKRSVTDFGVDCLEAWQDLPDGCADVLVSDGGLAAVEAPLETLRQARAKLRAGGKAVILAGEEGSGGKPALYAWTGETLGNLARAAGFRVVSAGPAEPGSPRIKVLAEKA